jgi:hypothetical protein
MSVDEARRSALFQAAVQALGEDPAVTMFELLPPPETDLATTADLASLEERLGARIDGVEQRLGARIDGLDAGIDGVEQRLGARIDGLDAGIDGVEQRLGARIDGLDARIDGVVQSIDHLAETLRTEMALQREELLGAFRGELVAAISGQTRGIVVALTVAVITGVVGIGGLAVTLSQLL